MDTEYMFGRSFLVRPVTDSLYTWQDKKQNGYQKNMRKIEKTDVYLPEGSNWFDFWTGQSWLVAKPYSVKYLLISCLFISVPVL